MRRLQQRIGDQHDLGVVAVLEVLHPVTLFVQQVGGYFDRQLRDDFRRSLLARFLADDAQDCKRQRLDAADSAESGTAGAGHV